MEFEEKWKLAQKISSNPEIAHQIANPDLKADLERITLTFYLSYPNKHGDPEDCTSAELLQKGINFIKKEYPFMFDEIIIVDSTYDYSLVKIGNKAFFLVRGTVLDNGFASKGRDMFNNSMIALGLEPNRVSKFDHYKTFA